ncbi:hypothetical protein [Azospirillum sp. sgz302134]
MDRVEPMLLSLLAAAVLGQMLSTAPVRFEALFAAPRDPAPFDVASIMIPPDEPIPHRVAMSDQAAPEDRNDCFCGAN